MFGCLVNLFTKFSRYSKTTKKKEPLFRIYRQRKPPEGSGLVYSFLLQDVKNVGLKNMTVRVNRGFARHFLYPKRLAIPLTPRTLAENPGLLSSPIPFPQKTIEKAETCLRKAKKLLREELVCIVENPKSMLITPWHLAPILTKQRKIDLLPENLYFPRGFITKPGTHKIKVIHQNGLYVTLPVVVKCRVHNKPEKSD
ncbi:hypothetical protein RF11_14057 [Thelohanellus kitauei]|uniref:Large ribosomal subunit protein bL9m n=1 Tax=Thelohanellus kitauei TaxID=669202 RepID=A0A0C2N279_THEKT|nr:hypothetical protein RF11_14057 [Thelohanellus kitauei]